MEQSVGLSQGWNHLNSDQPQGRKCVGHLKHSTGTEKGRAVSQSVQAAATKHHRLSGLNSRSLFLTALQAGSQYQGAA